MKTIQTLLGRFTFCIGIGIDQITPQFKTISWWATKEIEVNNADNTRHLKPKMFNVKPQPFSVQIKHKKKQHQVVNKKWFGNL